MNELTVCPECSAENRVDMENIPVHGGIICCTECQRHFPVLKPDNYYRSHFSHEMASFVINRKRSHLTTNLEFTIQRIQSFEDFLQKRDCLARDASYDDIQEFLKDVEAREGEEKRRGSQLTLSNFYDVLYQEGILQNRPPWLKTISKEREKEHPAFSDAINIYIRYRRREHYSKSDIVFDIKRIKVLEKYLQKEGKDLLGASRQDLRTFIEFIGKNRAPNQVKGFIISLIEFYGVLMEDRAILRNPALTLYGTMLQQDETKDWQAVSSSLEEIEETERKGDSIIPWVVAGTVLAGAASGAVIFFADSPKAPPPPRTTQTPPPVVKSLPAPVPASTPPIERLVEDSVKKALEANAEAERRLLEKQRLEAEKEAWEQKRLEAERREAAERKRKEALEESKRAALAKQQDMLEAEKARILAEQKRQKEKRAEELKKKKAEKAKQAATVAKPIQKKTIKKAEKHRVGCLDGNCQNGVGTYGYPDGTRYIGEWKDGKRHGQGIFQMKYGGQFTSEWRHGERLSWRNKQSPLQSTNPSQIIKKTSDLLKEAEQNPNNPSASVSKKQPEANTVVKDTVQELSPDP
ncbi:MJ0042-type zinc finger domain-containing protein [Magnetococcales bacterium HHB-1]